MRNICSIEGCEEYCIGRGWCRKHYYRWYRTGSTETTRARGLCTIEGCEKPHVAHGYCSMHLSRWQRQGDPLIQGQFKVYGTLAERVFARIDKNGSLAKLRPDLGRCWMWTGAANPNGYGTFNIGAGKLQPAHRLVYELMVGPIPPGLVMDHFACEVPLCVNPQHVRPVSQRENLLRANGVGSWNAAKTHCKWGHPFDEYNTYRDKDGVRYCRECFARRAAEYAERKRGQ